MQISLESVLSTIETTKNVVDATKVVCKNHEKYTQHIRNESLKRNLKTTAETMLTYIETAEQYIDDTIEQAKNRFAKLTDDILGVQQKYGAWIDELNEWLGIPELEAQMVNQRLSEFAKEFPNHQKFYKGTIQDRINLYIVAISKKIEELIQKLYDVVQEYVEKLIQKLKEWIDPYLQKLKEFGDELVQYVTDWLGDLIDFDAFNGILGDAEDLLKSGWEMAQDLMKEIGLNPPDLGGIPDLLGLGNSVDIDLKIDDIKQFAEGIFQGTKDPRSAAFTAEEGSGVTEGDNGGAQLFKVPESAYNTEYTKQFPQITPGGHVEDKDDTPGSERYYRAHPAGTFTEEQPDGQRINKIVGSNFEIIERDGNVEIKGKCTIIIGGDAIINVAGNQNITVGRDSVQMIKGNAMQTVLGNLDQKVNGNVNEYIIGQVKSKIDGQVDQQITGDVNQKMNGNTWSYIMGNVEQQIDGQTKQYIKGNSEQYIDGNSLQNIKGNQDQKITGNCQQTINGTLTQKITGDVNQTLSANVSANVGGNFDLQISGQFNVNQQSTTLQQQGETTIQGSRISLN